MALAIFSEDYLHFIVWRGTRNHNIDGIGVFQVCACVE